MKTLLSDLRLSVSSVEIFAYVFILAICFFLFQQADLYHTVASSYGYLKGHFLDFYEYNENPSIGGNDYLPLLYLIFAAWNFPVYLLGLTSDVMASGYLGLRPIEVFWSKLMLVGFFFATTLMVGKVAKLIAGNREAAIASAISFATAPIAIFAVFIMGQYDIIGLFFIVAGFYYYLKRNTPYFVLLFGVAVSFKYFALPGNIVLLFLARYFFINYTQRTYYTA